MKWQINTENISKGKSTPWLVHCSVQCWIHSSVHWDFGYALAIAVNLSPSFQLEARLNRVAEDRILCSLYSYPLTVMSSNIIECILSSEIWSPSRLRSRFTICHRQVLLSTCEVHSITEMPAYPSSPCILGRLGFASRSWNIHHCCSLSCWLHGTYKSLL